MPSMLTACNASCDAWVVSAVNFANVDEPESVAGASVLEGIASTLNEIFSGGRASACANVQVPAKPKPATKMIKLRRHSRNVVIKSIFSRRNLCNVSQIGKDCQNLLW